MYLYWVSFLEVNEVESYRSFRRMLSRVFRTRDMLKKEWVTMGQRQHNRKNELDTATAS